MGDKVLTINGVDMEGVRQDQAVSLLSGLDRFVRLVVQRKKVYVLIGFPYPYTLNTLSMPKSTK